MILRISFLLVILLIVPALYICRVHLKDKNNRWKILFWLPNVLLILFTVFFSIFRQYSFEQADLTGLYLIVTLCVCVPETLYALFLFFSQRTSHKKVSLLFLIFGGLLSSSGLFILLWGYLMGNRHVVSRDFSYPSDRVPSAFDGYRIVQFSDFHIGTFRNNPMFVKKVVEAINRQKPDLVVFTGDLVNFRSEELLPHMDALKKIEARDGVASILGNHDYMSYIKWPSTVSRQSDTKILISLQESIGWKVLLNENLCVRKGADSIFIAGVENDGKPPFPQRGDLQMALKGVPQGAFTVLLSHDPTHWRRKVLPETDIPLTLSGHTHGMQFKLGGFSPASWFYDEWGGTYFEDGRALFVSLGVGEVLLPYRFGAWPEITVITLHKQR